jgi:RNA polymerase sigma-70 factor, ECF subfamily
VQFTEFDARYLERLRAGDARTERHFVAYFSELIALKVRSRPNARDAIEDIRQETFVRVLALLRSAEGIRQPERLGALVNSVCNYVLLEQGRARGRKHSSIDDEPEGEFISPERSAAGLYEADEARRMVNNVLGALPDRDRSLLQCALLDQRDKDEICAEFGLSREYLRVLVHRAKQTFKTIYLRRLNETQSRGSEP